MMVNPAGHSPRPSTVTPAAVEGVDAAVQREVSLAFANTPMDYLKQCLRQRNPGSGAVGSVFREPLELAGLRDAKWSCYPHPNVSAPFRAYQAAIPGALGVVPLSELYPRSYLRLVDSKNTGHVKPVVILRRHTRPPTDLTTLIVGPDPQTGRPRVWTFHPGEPNPLPPRQKARWNDEIVSVAEARAAGFTWANVDAR